MHFNASVLFSSLTFLRFRTATKVGQFTFVPEDFSKDFVYVPPDQKTKRN